MVRVQHPRGYLSGWVCIRTLPWGSFLGPTPRLLTRQGEGLSLDPSGIGGIGECVRYVT